MKRLLILMTLFISSEVLLSTHLNHRSLKEVVAESDLIIVARRVVEITDQEINFTDPQHFIIEKFIFSKTKSSPQDSTN